jgi:hypothetical protein
MSAFTEELLFDVVFAGFYQAAFALAFVGPPLLAAVHFLHLSLARVLQGFALFNLFLFAWSALGNFAWLQLTWDRITVLDDAPVWASFLPFGRYLLDHAAGGRDGWHLIGDTTIVQLTVFWAATAIPVWLLTISTMCLYLRTYAARPAQQVG